MKKISRIIFMLLIIFVPFTGCDDDEDIKDLNLITLTCGNVDLYAATSATNVPVDQPIVAVFSTNIDEATVAAAISLMKGASNVPFTTAVDGKTLTITITGGLITGTNYSLNVSAALKSTQGAVLGAVSATFTTLGVGIDTPPKANNQVLYLQFNNSIDDVVGDHTNPFTQVAYTTDRFGTANGAANFRGATAAGNGDIVEIAGADLINPSMTFSVWFKVNSADYATGGHPMFGLATERGYFMELGGTLAWCKFATSHKIDPDPNNHYFGTAWTDPNGDGTIGGQTLYDYEGSLATIMGDKWTLLTMTFDAATSIKTIYFDGVKIMQVDLDFEATEWNLADMEIADQADGTGAAITGIEEVLTLGFMCSRGNSATGWSIYSSADNTFKGALDDLRIFDLALTESEVLALFNSEND